MDKSIYEQVHINNEGLVYVALEGAVEERGTETMNGDGGGSYRYIRMLVHRTGRHARPAVAIKTRALRSAPESRESLMISQPRC